MDEAEKLAEELLPYHPSFFGGDVAYRQHINRIAATLRELMEANTGLRFANAAQKTTLQIKQNEIELLKRKQDHYIQESQKILMECEAEKDAEIQRLQGQIIYEQERNQNNVAMKDLRIAEKDAEIERLKADIQNLSPLPQANSGTHRF